MQVVGKCKATAFSAIPAGWSADAYLQFHQQLYDKKQALSKVLQIDGIARLAINNHHRVWSNVMLKLDLLRNKGCVSPSEIKTEERWAKEHTCAKKLTTKGVAYKNWAVRMKPYQRLYHVTTDDLRQGTYSYLRQEMHLESEMLWAAVYHRS
jgi:hypothetical protein